MARAKASAIVKEVPRIVNRVFGREAIQLAERTPDLRTVSDVDISFCPWQANSSSTKEFWIKIASEEVQESNKRCHLRTKVNHDGSNPEIKIAFNDGEKLTMKGANLKISEIMYHFNAFCHNKQIEMDGKKEALF